jgi:hypothetical protein
VFKKLKKWTIMRSGPGLGYVILTRWICRHGSLIKLMMGKKRFFYHSFKKTPFENKCGVIFNNVLQGKGQAFAESSRL